MYWDYDDDAAHMPAETLPSTPAPKRECVYGYVYVYTK